MIATDWAVDERRGDSGFNGATGDVLELTLRSVDIDLNSDDRPQDFGKELIVGTFEGDDGEWPKVKRMLEACPNMLSCLRMVVSGRPTAVDYARRIIEFVDRKERS